MRETDHAEELQRALTDPQRLCRDLNLLNGSQRQATGVLIRCPAHKEKNASCSVTLGPDGTIRVKCFACDFAGNVFSLVATAYGLDIRNQFREVLEEAANIAGRHDLAEEIRGGKAVGSPRPLMSPPVITPPVPEPDYPEIRDVEAVWNSAQAVTDDIDISTYLEGRGITARIVTMYNLARVMALTTIRPRWARYQGVSWFETGHRLLVPVYTPDGQRRSLRAWRVIDGETPKRLPPGGHKASGLILANPNACALLRGEIGPTLVIVVEGEPDFLTHACRAEGPVIGVLSGSWTQEFANRIPLGSEVIVRTHHDRAGDKYSTEIIKSIAKRCMVWRSTEAA